MRWDGKVALVTGASSGIGRRLAVLLARKGATVIAVARREERLRFLVAELGGEPHSYVVCDVSDLEAVRAMAASAAQRAGALDVLVNNAGIRSFGPVTATTSEASEAVIRTNLLGAMWCTRELLPLLKAAPGSGRTPAIVNVASIAGRVAIPRSADYTASKFGLVGFTEALWHDLEPLGIRVMMVNPGPAHTEGFPMDRVLANPLTSWTVMDDERVARSIVRGLESGAFEVRVQWWLHLVYGTSVAAGPLRRLVARIVSRQIPEEL